MDQSEKKKVLVAIDLSECSRYALQWALDNLGETMANSEVVLFTVQPIVDFSYAYVSTLGATRASLSLIIIYLLIIVLFINACFNVFCGLLCFTAPDLINSVRENHEKVALALLEKAKEICTKKGV